VELGQLGKGAPGALLYCVGFHAGIHTHTIQQAHTLHTHTYIHTHTHIHTYYIYQAEETTKASTSQAKEMEEEMQGMENKIAELEAEKKSKQAEIKMLQQAKDSESGGEMKELEEEAAEISKGLVKATSAWQHSKENLGTDSQKSQYTHTQNIHTQSTLAYVHIYMSGLYEE
jgi:hypothetical protein